MNSLSNDEITILVAEMLTVWKNQDRDTISLDKETYVSLFSFLTPVHTIHEKSSGNPYFFLFPKEDSITKIINHYNLKQKCHIVT